MFKKIAIFLIATLILMSGCTTTNLDSYSDFINNAKPMEEYGVLLNYSQYIIQSQGNESMKLVVVDLIKNKDITNCFYKYTNGSDNIMYVCVDPGFNVVEHGNINGDFNDLHCYFKTGSNMSIVACADLNPN